MRDNPQYRPSFLTAAAVCLLGAVYLLLSVGVLKSTHFCMGREASVVFFSAEAEKCACSLLAGESEDCCDDERALLSIEDSRKTVSTFQLTVPALALLAVMVEPVPLVLQTHQGSLYQFVQERPSPPDRLYTMHCSLVLYDEALIA